MTTRVLVFLVLLTGSAVAKPKIAILGLEAPAGDAATARAVTTALRDQPRMSPIPYVLAPGSEQTLAEMKRTHECASEAVACMVAIGADLGADVLMYGHLETTSKGTRVGLKVLVIAKKQLANAFVDVIPADASDADRAAWARHAYAKLTR